ncbi:DNA cytosine methyltransferase [Clostridium sp. LQ25]|uniref:DNA cytosine methyltransferase n=1 Tax=Clostridium sp. LQ25 TaxID=2992805 RepID=UPI00225ACC52|nr:DNA cytosine methyltransferase [Clostridium sp. LQ25]UZT06628.1 DNA cytosine methyltransferase [Clostridium sp. LQ25]
MKKKHTLVSLFSGAGGMDLGFKKAGFNILWANDFNLDATITYKNNIGDHVVHGDICSIDSSEIPGSSDINSEENLDVIIGGFPCQGFSIANTKRSMEDERNFLYKEMLRVINDKKPKIFVAENVKGILSMQKGKVIEMIKKDFENLGYVVDIKILNAAEYGVPQARERVIIMGNRIGVKNKFPIRTHSNNVKEEQISLKEVTNNYINYNVVKNPEPFITTEEAIGFLQDIKVTPKPLEVNGRKIYNHIAYENVSDKFWARKYPVDQADICDYLKHWRDLAGWTTKKVDDHFGYKYTAGHWFRKDNKSGSIPKPDDWWELKKILGFDNKYDKQVTEFVEKKIVFEQSLRITNWDRASDTITATSPEIHVNKLRRLSVRECAILQTFPDDFIFYGSMNSMHRQVGNAVPVDLARQIGKCVIEMLEEQE